MKWVKTMQEGSAELFSVATVSQAIGRSEGSISAYFSNKGITTKGGLTIDQIIEAMEAPQRGQAIDWDGVRRIEQLLRDRGYSKEDEGE